MAPPPRGATASGRRACRRGGDDGRTREADGHAQQVPAVRPAALDGPEPEDRGGDVDAAVCGVGPPGGVAVHQGQRVGEQGQGRHAGEQPPGRLAHTPPGPEGEAARDLGERRADVGEDGGHGAWV